MKNLNKDFSAKFKKISSGSDSSDYYYEKLTELEQQIVDIYSDPKLSMVHKGERISDIAKLFEKYVEKYESKENDINILQKEYEREIEIIIDMIAQSKPNVNIEDINNAVSEYIIIKE